MVTNNNKFPKFENVEKQILHIEGLLNINF